MKHIYVIEVKFKGCSYCKIGITQNLNSRLAQISTGCPEAPAIAYSKLSDIAQLCEAECHRRLSKFRRNGEWFQIGRNEAIQVVKDVSSTIPSSWANARRDFFDLINTTAKAERLGMTTGKVKSPKFKAIHHCSDNGFGTLIVTPSSMRMDGYELIASGVGGKQVSKMLEFINCHLEDVSIMSVNGGDHEVLTYGLSSEDLRVKCINLLKS